MSETTNSISSNFDSGASYLISEDGYDWWIVNNGGKGPGIALIGRTDGQFVVPSNEMDEVLLKANGDPRIMEDMLGLEPPGSLGDSPVRVNILNPKDYNLRLPDSSMSGANGKFIAGGKTSGDVSEGVIDQFPNPDYAPEIGNIGKASESLEKLTRAEAFADSMASSASTSEQSILSKMVGFIAKHPEATARVLTYGAIGISAFNMCKQACKEFECGNDKNGYRIIARWAVTTEASVIGVWGGAAIGGLIGGPIGFVIGLGLGMGFGSLAGYWSGELFDEIFGLYNDAGAYTYPVDPLIFDLNGDGVKTVALADGVHFDFDRNGFAEKIGWVSPEDGLLVRDLDKNGRIDSGRELMGDLTEVADDLVAANGFEALAYFDTNADGVIDAKDDIYRELQIWQDKNQNGTVEDGELMSLKEAGIAGINLAYDNINVTDESGNGHSQKSTYTRTDGTVLSVEDVWFEKDAANTVVNDSQENKVFLEETEEIQNLPDIQGKGNQYSLHQAMLRDETGGLKKLVEDYIAETDRAVRKSMLLEIIYVWTGVNEVEETSRGDSISDARKLAALEVITGRDFNSAYGANPVRQAGVYLEEAFDKLVELYFGQLEMQTTYASEYAELFMNLNIDEDGNIIYGLASVAEKYMAEYEENPAAGKDHIFDFVDNLRKTGMDLTIGREKVYQTFSVTDSDLYHAIDYRGDDVISGSDKNDTLTGEGGNDTLKGGAGDDTYIFHMGDGQDTIEETSGTDTILFGEGIREEDIHVSRDNKNLYLTNLKNGDCITVWEFFYNRNRQVEKVEFANGSSWDMDVIRDKARYYYGGEGDDRIDGWNINNNVPALEDDHIYGGAGNDTLYGNNGNDELYGEEGNDTINGGAGDDLLSGGAGDDTLYGGIGDDTYIFHMGDGQDTIEETSGTDTILFGEGIREEDIRISRDNKNLYLTNLKNGDCITVREFFYNKNRQVEKVEFADGSSWDMDVIKDKARYYYGGEGDDRIDGWNINNNVPALEDDHIYGGAGNDTLYGNNGNDELYGEEGNDTINGGAGDDLLSGGAGDDTLYGGIGDDTYIFHMGDGQDTIEETGGTDTILFGEGIREEDIHASRDNKNLYLTNLKNGDCITVREFFHNKNRQVEKVEFADGSSWDKDVIKDKARYYYGGEGDDRIDGWNINNNVPALEDDHIYGGAGNDTIYGNNGNDELYGEEGNDTINGGAGDDLLSGGVGDDTLYGGIGDDTYIFHMGDGQDTIEETGGTDTILFGEGIREEDIHVSRDNKNLYLTNLKNGDCITVREFFYNKNRQVEKVEFADGSSWDKDVIKDKARYYYGGEGDDRIDGWNIYNNVPALEDDHIYGGAGNDTIYGNNGNDALYGEEGDDTINGGAGNDLLSGGAGNDMLYGGVGDDTYIYNAGDGRDTISDTSGNDRVVFGEGIENSDLTFYKEKNDLRISIRGNGDITVLNYFINDNYKVESFQAFDGSEMVVKIEPELAAASSSVYNNNVNTKLNVMIQAMASFEDTNGMMWEDAVEQKNEQANDRINQWWTKKAI